MTENELKAVKAFVARGLPGLSICACMGPADIYGMPGKQEPLCLCAMQWVVEIEGEYFKISQSSTETGIEFTAHSIGPVGGPYNE